METMTKLLTPYEVADDLNVSWQKVTDMCRHGEFKGFAGKVGAKWRISESGYVEWRNRTFGGVSDGR